jgi:hypothetical protein
VCFEFEEAADKCLP